MDRSQFTRYLQSLVAIHGNQRRLASHLGISPQMMSDLLSERRDPGAGVLARLELRKSVTYQKIR